MKKFTAAMVMIAFILCMTACSADDSIRSQENAVAGVKEDTAGADTTNTEEIVEDASATGKETTEINTTETDITETDTAETESEETEGDVYILEPRAVPEGYETARGLLATELVSELKVGWNLGNTMDAAGGETAWGNPTTTQELIDAVAAKGFNTLRIPTSWGQFAKEKDGKYMISPNWLNRVGEIADYALKNDMYVIINTHHETDWLVPTNSKMEEAEPRFIAIWTQIASYFKDYGDHIIFEGLNEPRVVGGPQEWNGGNYENRDNINRLNRDFVNTVRAIKGNNETRLLLITSEAASVSDNALGDVRIPNNDPYVGMSLHAYTPYEFTYAAAHGYDTWDGSHTYDISWMFGQLDKYFLSKGIPVVLTEYGAERRGKGETNNDEQVCYWIKDYLTLAKENGVPTVIWDNGITDGQGERFGLIDRRKLTWDRESVVDTIMQVVYK